MEVKKQNNLKTHLGFLELPEGSGLDYSDFETEIVNMIDEEILAVKTDLSKQLAAKTKSAPTEKQDIETHITETKPTDLRCNSKGSIVKIITTYRWDENELKNYQEALQKQMMLLDKFSDSWLEQATIAKSTLFIPPEQNSKNQEGTYGEVYEIQNEAISCAQIEAYIEKAVMWSQHVSKAYLNCHCEKTIEVSKIQ
ncbi:unnamed protein product, partial [Mesorhabditis belari]|uniref:Uncharacterized protein n=1 Tax=Mesorhabditis belari TaxID=2138241 RepID=A0AAF3F4Z5_9BILA